jgi:hypothetical protein
MKHPASPRVVTLVGPQSEGETTGVDPRLLR